MSLFLRAHHIIFILFASINFNLLFDMTGQYGSLPDFPFGSLFVIIALTIPHLAYEARLHILGPRRYLHDLRGHMFRVGSLQTQIGLSFLETLMPHLLFIWDIKDRVLLSAVFPYEIGT